MIYDPEEYTEALAGARELLTSLASIYEVVEIRDPSGSGELIETEQLRPGGPFPCGVGPVRGREAINYSQEVAIADAMLYFEPMTIVARTDVVYVTDVAWVGARRFELLGVTQSSGNPVLKPVAALETQ